MITGIVNRRHEIILSLLLYDASGRERTIEAILDTGFTGSLTLPRSHVEDLGLRWRSRSSAILANGNVAEFDLFAATIIWDGNEHPILVQEIENAPLLGMSMLVGYDMTVRVIEGGLVTISAIA
jgi:clan AA aspartic protease